MTQNEGHYILFSRADFLQRFIDRIYKQRNIKRVADGDKLLIPKDKIEDFIYDLGVVLGKTVIDVIGDMEESEKEG